MKRQVVDNQDFRAEKLQVTSIDEALDYLLPRIRRQSRACYEKEIRHDLAVEGSTLVDHHAGQGSYFMVELVQ